MTHSPSDEVLSVSSNFGHRRARRSQSTGPYPASFQGFINDPNSVLREAIAGQDILGFIAINLTTDSQSSDGLPTFGRW
jgi:hypothetical protein